MSLVAEHRPEAFCVAWWIHPSGFTETVRPCVPGDEVRRCDCNRNKGRCHCSDSDSEWDPFVTQCECQPVFAEQEVA